MNISYKMYILSRTQPKPDLKTEAKCITDYTNINNSFSVIKTRSSLLLCLSIHYDEGTREFTENTEPYCIRQAAMYLT